MKELSDVRHDLRNVLTALKSGCMLIESRLGSEGDAEILEYLAEMRAQLASGSSLLDELRAPSDRRSE